MSRRARRAFRTRVDEDSDITAGGLRDDATKAARLRVGDRRRAHHEVLVISAAEDLQVRHRRVATVRFEKATRFVSGIMMPRPRSARLEREDRLESFRGPVQELGIEVSGCCRGSRTPCRVLEATSFRRDFT